MVQREGLVDKLHVSADGTGQVGHAGSALLAGVADRVGLTRALSEAMVSTRQRRSAHDPGVVLRDLAVMLADGGDCLADLGAQRDQADLFGDVASDATAFRVIDSVDERCLERLRAAVALARARAWKLGARPQRREGAEQAERTVIDIDATLIGAHSEKEGAQGTFKKGFGHHPLLCYLDGSGEAPAGILREGKAGSNTAADHIAVLDLALEQLDEQALEGRDPGARRRCRLNARSDRLLPRGSDALLGRLRPGRAGARGDPHHAPVRLDKRDPPDGSERRDSQVCEITDHVDLCAWPEGSRLIARRTKLKEGEQQSFADHDGYRLAVFLTDQPDPDITALDLTHRGHARVEDRIREGKDCGLANLPFRSFAHNQVWLWLVQLAQDLIAWTKQLALAEQARSWELKRLRYRLLHQSGRIARHARRNPLRLARDWPWSEQLAAAFSACKRCQPRPADRQRPRRSPRPRSSAEPPASACPQTTPQSPQARPSPRQTGRTALPAAFTTTANALQPCTLPGRSLTASGANQTLAARSRLMHHACPDRAVDKLVPSLPRRGAYRATMVRWPLSTGSTPPLAVAGWDTLTLASAAVLSTEDVLGRLESTAAGLSRERCLGATGGGRAERVAQPRRTPVRGAGASATQSAVDPARGRGTDLVRRR